ncbi:MAG: HAD-IIA family hydrolase [Kiritimatiellaeota bacterium]|nr:HAD-IIA family hydrolase [Kiritimatiellota bacterium]
MPTMDSFRNWWRDGKSNYSALLFDVDGTIIAGGKALAGASELLADLRSADFPFRLLTNDGNHSPEEKSAIMRKCGLDISSGEITSCSMALTPYVSRNGLAGKRFFVMGDLGKPSYAERAGLTHVRDTDDITSCEGVIVGEGTYDWKKNIDAVLNYYITTENRLMLVPNPDSYWPNGPNGEIGIGAGGKARFIATILKEYGIRIKPVYLGKPYSPIYRAALREIRAKYHPRKIESGGKVLMIGDSLLSDVRGAKRIGFSSALVLTGISKMSHVEKARPSCVPDLIFRGL